MWHFQQRCQVGEAVPTYETCTGCGPEPKPCASTTCSAVPFSHYPGSGGKGRPVAFHGVLEHHDAHRALQVISLVPVWAAHKLCMSQFPSHTQCTGCLARYVAGCPSVMVNKCSLHVVPVCIPDTIIFCHNPQGSAIFRCLSWATAAAMRGFLTSACRQLAS